MPFVRNDNVGLQTTAVGIAEVQLHRLALTRHQRKIVVGIEHRKDLLAVAADKLDTDEQGRLGTRVPYVDLSAPFVALLRETAGDIERRLAERLRQCTQVVGLTTLDIKVVGDDGSTVEEPQP